MNNRTNHKPANFIWRSRCSQQDLFNKVGKRQNLNMKAGGLYTRHSWRNVDDTMLAMVC